MVLCTHGKLQENIRDYKRGGHCRILEREATATLTRNWRIGDGRGLGKEVLLKPLKLVSLLQFLSNKQLVLANALNSCIILSEADYAC